MNCSEIALLILAVVLTINSIWLAIKLDNKNKEWDIFLQKLMNKLTERQYKIQSLQYKLDQVAEALNMSLGQSEGLYSYILVHLGPEHFGPGGEVPKDLKALKSKIDTLRIYSNFVHNLITEEKQNDISRGKHSPPTRPGDCPPV